MKKIFTLAHILIIFSNCLAQNFRLSLIGSWKEIEYHGNDGAKDYLRKIENGRILTFETSNVVKDENGNKGIYQIKGDSLHILLPKNEKFYRFYFEKNNSKRIGLSPVTEKYEIICDEGCSEVYEKSDNLKIVNTKIITGFVFEEHMIPAQMEVSVKGTNVKTQTDGDGKFTLMVNEGDIILITSLFERTIEITITEKNCYEAYLFRDTGLIYRTKKGNRERNKIRRKSIRKFKKGFYDCNN